MKHNNESISRLDGDIYENINSDTIDMSKVFSVSAMMVSGGLPYPGKPFYRISFSGGEMNVIFDDGDSTIDSDPHWIENRKNQYEHNRQQFIEVWKHWKSKQ